MHKHIIAVGALDKAIALCGVKPFHDTFFSHYSFLLTSGAAHSVPQNGQNVTTRKRLWLKLFLRRQNAQSIENWTIISQDLPASAREECVWNHTIGESGKGAWGSHWAKTLGWEDVFGHDYSPGGILLSPP